MVAVCTPVAVFTVSSQESFASNVSAQKPGVDQAQNSLTDTLTEIGAFASVITWYPFRAKLCSTSKRVRSVTVCPGGGAIPPLPLPKPLRGPPILRSFCWGERVVTSPSTDGVEGS